MRRLFSIALSAAAVLAFTAAPASAEPSENASCVAQYVHGPPGPPGQFQSDRHLPKFGQNVSRIAHRDPCPL